METLFRYIENNTLFSVKYHKHTPLESQGHCFAASVKHRIRRNRSLGPARYYLCAHTTARHVWYVHTFQLFSGM
jgi:hypothetical protein